MTKLFDVFDGTGFSLDDDETTLILFDGCFELVGLLDLLLLLELLLLELELGCATRFEFSW